MTRQDLPPSVGGAYDPTELFDPYQGFTSRLETVLGEVVDHHQAAGRERAAAAVQDVLDELEHPETDRDFLEYYTRTRAEQTDDHQRAMGYRDAHEVIGGIV